MLNTCSRRFITIIARHLEHLGSKDQLDSKFRGRSRPLTVWSLATCHSCMSDDPRRAIPGLAGAPSLPARLRPPSSHTLRGNWCTIPTNNKKNAKLRIRYFNFQSTSHQHDRRCFGTVRPGVTSKCMCTPKETGCTRADISGSNAGRTSGTLVWGIHIGPCRVVPQHFISTATSSVGPECRSVAGRPCI